MPDIQDVESSIVVLVAATLLPNVTNYVPGVVSADASGNKYRIYRGWPQGDIIENDAKANITNISVVPIPNTFRNTSRILSKWYMPRTTALPTMAATVSGQTVTFSGSPAIGLVAGVVTNKVAYRYQLLGTDTLNSVAAAFAGAIPGATASGAVLTLPYGPVMAAVVFNTGTAYKETSRQTVQDRITIWAPTNDQRDTISNSLINVFSQTPFLTVGLSTARFISDNLVNNDDAIQSGIFRRDLIYTLEWPTVVFQTVPIMGFPVMTPTAPVVDVASINNIQS